MIRIKEIQDKLQNLVGWEQADGTIESESGLTFQMAHPLVTLQNVRSIMPEGADLDEYLERLTRNGIAKAVQTFVQMKRLSRETRSLLERRTFFDGAGRVRDFIVPNGRMVGYEIVPVRSMGVTTKIERIGLQMTGATGKVKLYLFHSSQVEPIKVVEVDFTRENGGYQWFDMADWFLPYIGDENNAGGSWYICYNQAELPSLMRAVNISKDWSREPCGTCNRGDLQSWREMTKYIQISPFAVKVQSDFAENPEMWDVANNVYTPSMCYGINVEVSVGCDLTDFIVRQRDMFATVVQRQVAYDMLRTLAMNPDVRVNRNQSNASRMDILYELDGNTEGKHRSGLGYDLQKAYEALSLDTRGLDRVCLTCDNGGVRYRTV
ncbi:MAG: hypothetical protein IIW53_04800 [Rikenellaceae bacterium]|nr:hypothetical protein [Rikenellaceae bacterium]MBQ5371455.1 hypothetical protein [Rikenellaceae bacterium]MBQ5853395.1 hypothetical protein [Rikenellaceae bacterium]